MQGGNTVKIIEYEDRYAEEISKIIIQNLLEVNSKDYGIEFVQNFSKEFTPEKFEKFFLKEQKPL